MPLTRHDLERFRSSVNSAIDDLLLKMEPEKEEKPSVKSTPLLVPEIAEECRVSVSTVCNWINTGKLAAYKFGRRILVERSDLDAFLAKSRHEATR